MKLFVKRSKELSEKTLKKAYEKDAAMDVVATSEAIIVGNYIERFDGVKIYSKIHYIEYRTGLFLSPQKENDIDFHIEIFPRSSISNKNLILCNGIGLADADYKGEYICRFKYIPNGEDFVVIPEGGMNKVYINVNPELIYNINDKICQIKPSPNIHVELELVDDLSFSERGSKGFGSSGI
jgi:dUTPase